jgi:hypothetical protein
MNQSKFKKLPIDTRIVDPNIIKATLSVKKDCQGNESGYWHSYFPEKNN